VQYSTGVLNECLPELSVRQLVGLGASLKQYSTSQAVLLNLVHASQVETRRYLRTEGLSEDVPDNAEHFLSTPMKHWLLSCGELCVSNGSDKDFGFWSEPRHQDGGMSVLHMGLTLYGNRALVFDQGEGTRLAQVALCSHFQLPPIKSSSLSIPGFVPQGGTCRGFVAHVLLAYLEQANPRSACITSPAPCTLEMSLGRTIRYSEDPPGFRTEQVLTCRARSTVLAGS
jgi:hypothetical protein